MRAIDIIKPLYTVLSAAFYKSLQHQEKILGDAENWTRGCWVRSKYAISVLLILYLIEVTTLIHLLWTSAIGTDQALAGYNFNPWTPMHFDSSTSSKTVFPSTRQSLQATFLSVVMPTLAKMRRENSLVDIATTKSQSHFSATCDN